MPRNKQKIYERYNYQCSLKHNHEIHFSYDFTEDTFKINKEQPVTKERIKQVEEEILEFLKNNYCEFCDKKVKREELTGFSHEGYNSLGTRLPICKDCWKEKQGAIENNEQFYCTLDHYLELIGGKDSERCKELASCSVLPNYPKTGKKDWTGFNQLDLEWIKRLEQEKNLAVEKQKWETFVKLNDEQKLFILEYLCYLRDNELREGERWGQFQKVIEMIREIYRNENKDNHSHGTSVREGV
ncbi:hypothetical protein [endosymbiont GvMRE of Glomus versiforme]|uniref:hypothetical protein n=1 Tax=endosymbiont GvMRE of Glomus versiforme TaxID=2039283 RepID=UPI000EEADF58|nr:hypothetical protein [endosymbiont GvMRE of Glomus versiforme]RHZ37390.1 hypothetical protein GvMRE_I1g545 [endosymbiont GvMRE of Glomus versiforme]